MDVLVHGATSIHLLISSDGGFNVPGYGLYNSLIGWPVPVITHNVGSVNSISNMMFLAGSRRLASPSATFLLHGTTWTIPSPTVLTRDQISEINDAIVADEGRMADIFAARCGMDRAVAVNLIDEGATLDTAFALANGIIHAVEAVSIPPGSIVRQV
jgi:ATP-dependent Clp protease, protease subunit